MSPDQVNAPAEVPVSEDTELFAEEADCFALSDDLAWKFEVNICQQDVDRWRHEEDHKDMSFLVSAALSVNAVR